MNNKLRFLCDCDGIVADFMSQAIDIINKTTNQGLTYEDLVHWEVLDYVEHPEHKKTVSYELNAAGLCERIELYKDEEALAAVKELNELTNFYFITSPMHKNVGWFNERHAWVIKHFNVTPYQIGFIKDKFTVAGDFLLDDAESNLIKWIEEPYNKNSLALLWDRPWNRHVEDSRLIRVNSWKQVLDLVKKKI